MQFSAPVKKHWLGSFSIGLPPSGLRGLVPVVRERWEQGRPGALGPGAGGGGGGGQGPVSINVHTCMYLQMNESLFEQHGGPVLAKNCEIKILK